MNLMLIAKIIGLMLTNTCFYCQALVKCLPLKEMPIHCLGFLGTVIMSRSTLCR